MDGNSIPPGHAPSCSPSARRLFSVQTTKEPIKDTKRTGPGTAVPVGSKPAEKIESKSNCALNISNRHALGLT